MESINAVIGVDLLNQALLPSIIDLAEDSKWRVRLAIIELIPKLARNLGNDFFNDKLNGVCIGWLNDNVYAVREAATKNLCELVICFGEIWAVDFVIPRIERMLVHTNYLHRITAVHCIEALIKVLSVKSIESVILQLLNQASTDPVANVRLAVAKTIAFFPRNQFLEANQIFVKDLTNRLASDTDSDVTFSVQKSAAVMS
jgi:serine/threonine-protein phosphatase 2A regulatory subunit A